MNILKSLIALLFLVSVVLCNQAQAQSQNNQQQGQAQEEQVEQYEEYEEYNEEVEPYQQSVTLDEGDQSATTTDEGNAASDYDSKPATKIHIYSGAHDGDNIINPEPKR